MYTRGKQKSEDAKSVWPKCQARIGMRGWGGKRETFRRDTGVVLKPGGSVGVGTLTGIVVICPELVFLDLTLMIK